MSRSIRLNRLRDAYRWRFPLILSAALALLFLQTTAASAAGVQAPPMQPTAVDVICVEGLVINHEEQPLQGWTVTATYAEDPGIFEPLTATSRRNGTFRIELPAPGVWSFSIDIPEGWAGVTATSFVANISYGSDACATIRFKVKQVVTVIVIKIDDEHTPLPGWTIIASPGPGNLYGVEQRQTTNDQGIATFELTPGNWVFTEEPPESVTWYQPISPPDGTQSLDVTWPGPHTIRFKNFVKKGKGCIIVEKRDVPPDPNGQSFGLPDWRIDVLRTNGTIAATGTTDALGRVTFDDLPFGPYTVREALVPGWEPVSPTAFNVILARTDDDCQVVVFINRQDRGFCFEGIKQDANDGYGIAGWRITADPLDKGGIELAPVETDGLGRYRFTLPLDDYRVPGSQYQVCEADRAGWTHVGPTCHTVTLPWKPDACVQVPPFVNRQTKTENPPAPEPEPEKKGHNNHRPKWEDRNPRHQGNPGQCSTYHVVRRGESIYSIAPQYGTNGPALLRANPWVNQQRHRWVYVGQKVCIP